MIFFSYENIIFYIFNKYKNTIFLYLILTNRQYQLSDPLEHSITSHITRQFVMLDENISVANAVSQMHSKKVETIIVQTKDEKSFGVITDSDILDKVVIKGIDSD